MFSLSHDTGLISTEYPMVLGCHFRDFTFPCDHIVGRYRATPLSFRAGILSVVRQEKILKEIQILLTEEHILKNIKVNLNTPSIPLRSHFYPLSLLHSLLKVLTVLMDPNSDSKDSLLAVALTCPGGSPIAARVFALFGHHLPLAPIGKP